MATYEQKVRGLLRVGLIGELLGYSNAGKFYDDILLMGLSINFHHTLVGQLVYLTEPYVTAYKNMMFLTNYDKLKHWIRNLTTRFPENAHVRVLQTREIDTERTISNKLCLKSCANIATRLTLSSCATR